MPKIIMYTHVHPENGPWKWAINEILTYEDVIFANKKWGIFRDYLQYILTFCLL